MGPRGAFLFSALGVHTRVHAEGSGRLLALFGGNRWARGGIQRRVPLGWELEWRQFRRGVDWFRRATRRDAPSGRSKWLRCGSVCPPGSADSVPTSLSVSARWRGGAEVDAFGGDR